MLLRCFTRVAEAGGGTALREHQGAASPRPAPLQVPWLKGSCVYKTDAVTLLCAVSRRAPRVVGAGGREEQRAFPGLLREGGGCSGSSGEPGVCACTGALHVCSQTFQMISNLCFVTLWLSADFSPEKFRNDVIFQLLILQGKCCLRQTSELVPRIQRASNATRQYVQKGGKRLSLLIFKIIVKTHSCYFPSKSSLQVSSLLSPCGFPFYLLVSRRTSGTLGLQPNPRECGGVTESRARHCCIPSSSSSSNNLQQTRSQVFHLWSLSKLLTGF